MAEDNTGGGSANPIVFFDLTLGGKLLTTIRTYRVYVKSCVRSETLSSQICIVIRQSEYS